MITSCLIAVALLAQPAESSAGPKLSHGFPPVIALLVSGSEDKPVLVPLGIYEAKTWSLARLAPMTPVDLGKKPEPTMPEDKTFVESLLRQRFHASYDHSILFLPKDTARFNILDAPFFSLSGELFTTRVPWNKNEILLMTNRGTRIAKPKSLDHLENEASVLALAVKALTEREADAKTATDKLDPSLYTPEELAKMKAAFDKFDPALCQAPTIRQTTRFDLAEGRSAVWVHVERPYNKDAAPKNESFPDYPFWTEHYRAILETVHGKTYKPLWEDALIEIHPLDAHHTYDFVGACDGDGDGVSEVVLARSAWEATSFILFTLSKDKLVEASSISGAL